MHADDLAFCTSAVVLSRRDASHELDICYSAVVANEGAHSKSAIVLECVVAKFRCHISSRCYGTLNLLLLGWSLFWSGLSSNTAYVMHHMIQYAESISVTPFISCPRCAVLFSMECAVSARKCGFKKICRTYIQKKKKHIATKERR